MTELAWTAGAVLVVCFGLIVVRGAPYVPTHRAQLERAFKSLYRVSEADVVIDLGAGDGTVLAAASRHGAKAIGYELNPFLWLAMKYRFRRNPLVQVRCADFLRLHSLPGETTVVYAFATSLSIGAIESRLEKWSRRGSFVFISYGFELPSHHRVKKSGPMYLYDFRRR